MSVVIARDLGWTTVLKDLTYSLTTQGDVQQSCIPWVSLEDLRSSPEVLCVLVDLLDVYWRSEELWR